MVCVSVCVNGLCQWSVSMVCVKCVCQGLCQWSVSGVCVKCLCQVSVSSVCVNCLCQASVSSGVPRLTCAGMVIWSGLRIAAASNAGYRKARGEDPTSLSSSREPATGSADGPVVMVPGSEPWPVAMILHGRCKFETARSTVSSGTECRPVRECGSRYNFQPDS